MPANDKQVAGNHYRKQGIQHWDYVLANNIPYMEAQVIKYVSRWRDKNGMQDLQKAEHFLQKLIEYETEKQHKEAQVPMMGPKPSLNPWKGLQRIPDDGSEPGLGYVNQG